MPKHTTEETILNLILLFAPLLLVAILLPDHLIQLALRDMAGASLEIRQAVVAYWDTIAPIIRALGALVFNGVSAW